MSAAPATSAPAPVREASGLRLRRLRIEFNGMTAVDDLDLEIPAGQITVLLGPSGCGKSTILRAIAGLLTPASGVMEMDDLEVKGTSPDRAMVFQEDALLPWRNAAANVTLALALRRIPRSERAAQTRELLGQVGLEGYERHLPRQLSGGMRQRVQLARTLATRPRVMLMDEPFGALDAQTRGAMQQLLVDVWREHQTTIVFVTHDVDEALTIGDRVVVLSVRPASVRTIHEVASPRTPGGRFEPVFARSRYEILAQLGESPDDERCDGSEVP